MKLLFDGGITFAGEMGHEVSSKCDEEGPPVIIGIKVYNIRYEMANKVIDCIFLQFSTQNTCQRPKIDNAAASTMDAPLVSLEPPEILFIGAVPVLDERVFFVHHGCSIL